MRKDSMPREFRSKYHRVRLNVLCSSIWMQEYICGFMERYDITGQQYNILRIIQDNAKPLSVLQVREQMFEKLCDASRLVDRLILKELVSKKICTQDKRLIEIFLTEKGEALLARIAQNLEELDEPLRSLSEEEADQLCDLLTKMRHSQIKSEEKNA